MNDKEINEEAFKNFGLDLVDTVEKHVDKLDPVIICGMGLICFFRILNAFMPLEEIKKFTADALSEAIKERKDG